MLVIMPMLINRHRASITEEGKIFGMLIHRLRRAVAADVMIDAENGIGFLHHHVQVMRDQQNRAMR